MKRVKPLSTASREEFDLIMKNIVKKLEIKNSSALASVMGVSKAAISSAKAKNSIPAPWIKKLEGYGITRADFVPIEYQTNEPDTNQNQPTEEDDLRKFCHQSFEVIIDWILETNGTGYESIEIFREDFSERFPEFVAWRKNKRTTAKKNQQTKVRRS